MSRPEPTDNPETCSRVDPNPVRDATVREWLRPPYRRPLSLSLLLFLFVLQVVTGVLLMTVYSPSPATAWSSVWYVQTQVPGGWLIRGLHYFASDALLIVLGLASLQIVLAGAYRAEGARVWWITLGLLGLTLMLSLSGHLLPWDQEGYWGTTVRTNILARTPILGAALRRLLIGGAEFGHLTLTHFYTLHVIVLPGLAALLLARRLAAARTLSTPQESRRENQHNGPHDAPDRATNASEFVSHRRRLALWQSLAVASVLAALLGVVWYVRSVLGAELLDAPADPFASDYPARPEWHTLFLYQWLKYFHGPAMEVAGAIVLPGLVVGAWCAFPYLDRLMRPKVAFRVAVSVASVTVLGAAYLSLAAVRADRPPSDDQVAAVRSKQERGDALNPAEEAVLRAWAFNRQRAQARRTAERALTLAAERGIPPEGPLALLMSDPVTRGPVLFAAHCASCHRYDGHNGLGLVPRDPPASSDLGGYASRRWVRGLLADPMDDRYFGRMKKPDGEPAHTRMSRWLRRTRNEHAGAEERKKLLADFDAVAAYLEDESLHPGQWAEITADAGTPGSTPNPDRDREGATLPPNPDRNREGAVTAAALILRGRRFFMAVCNECHSYQGERTGTTKAPEMFGYGSMEWIEQMIADPSRDTRYRSRGREPAQMPAFQDRLSERDRRLIAEWLHASRSERAGAPDQSRVREQADESISAVLHQPPRARPFPF